MKIIYLLSSIALNIYTLQVFGQSGISKNLAAKKYQNAQLYLSSGETLEGELLVFVKDKLHHASKYKMKSDKKDIKIKAAGIDSIRVGESVYKKIRFKVVSTMPRDQGKSTTYTKFATQVVNGKNEVWVSFWVHDYGYTFVDDKANYFTYNYYLKNSKGTFSKIDNPRVGSVPGTNKARVYPPSPKEYKYVIKRIEKYFPDCFENLNIGSKENYDNIPDIVSTINESCEFSEGNFR